jgi:dTDP-glucose 4,6-dehydratase
LSTNQPLRNIVVTGGAGFIGSNFVRHTLDTHPNTRVHVLDALTYAGRLSNLEGVDKSRVEFTHGSICDAEAVKAACAGADAIVNFAAETHVDRSILDAGSFIQTDVAGVHVLLEYQRSAPQPVRLLHVSTDEVYGSIDEGSFVETDPFEPNSPYSASKAGGELLIRAYHVTYGADVVVTRGSNTFGPYQYPEKMLPLFISNLIDGQSVPIYGDGKQVRDWLAVEDHCRGIDIALRQGASGQAYNIGGGNERHNIDVTRALLQLLGKGDELIRHVTDRPGHDVRYSLDTSKLRKLGYAPAHSFEDDLAATVEWYRANEAWWREIKNSGDYVQFTKRWYGAR